MRLGRILKKKLHDLGMVERATGTADMKATVCLGKKRLWQVTNKTLNKGLSLFFEIKTNVREPSSFKWRITNTGDEAQIARDLRGGFTDTGEKNFHWETTKYRGTHQVEGFVIKDGICVARTAPKFIRVR